MPDITLPWDPAGLVLSVVVGLPQIRMHELLKAGLPVPNPVQVMGLIDTGSDCTVLSPQVIQHLQLSEVDRRENQTAIGSILAYLYEVSLVIVGPDGLAGPVMTRPHHVVVGATHQFPDPIEVLIGLDILGECVLHSDGPNRTFTLSF